MPAWSDSGEDSALLANCQLVATHSRKRMRQLSGIPFFLGGGSLLKGHQSYS